MTGRRSCSLWWEINRNHTLYCKKNKTKRVHNCSYNETLLPQTHICTHTVHSVAVSTLSSQLRGPASESIPMCLAGGSLWANGLSGHLANDFIGWRNVFISDTTNSITRYDRQYSCRLVNQSYCTLAFYVNFSENMPHVTTYSGKHYRFMVMWRWEYIGFFYFFLFHLLYLFIYLFFFCLSWVVPTWMHY